MTLGDAIFIKSPMKMIYRKLSKTASLPVTCHPLLAYGIRKANKSKVLAAHPPDTWAIRRASLSMGEELIQFHDWCVTPCVNANLRSCDRELVIGEALRFLSKSPGRGIAR